MAATAKVLVCLDPDPQPSVFDSIVAIDCGVDHLLRHGQVKPDQVQELVHGAMFTRGGHSLDNTAIFVGGSDVRAAEQIMLGVRDSFFADTRVSVMLDPRGANTTAAAAVFALSLHLEIAGTLVTVLGATGPVGSRVVRLLAGNGALVRVGSRDLERAENTCHDVKDVVKGAKLTPCETGSFEGLSEAMQNASAVISCGAAGQELLPEEMKMQCTQLAVAVDLNAVPPAGIGGVNATDSGVKRVIEGRQMICYGALGVGGMKMEVHRQAIERLYTERGCVLDAEEMYALIRDSV